MKIILLGANGRIGRKVLSQSLELGHKIAALVRSMKTLSAISHKQKNVHIGNVCD